MPLVLQRRLSRLRGPLAFPGGNPGIASSHPAARSLRFSGVAMGGNFINLINGKPGTLTLTPGAVIDGIAGPSLNFAGANNATSFAGMPAAADSNLTIGCIFIRTGFSSFDVMFATGPSSVTLSIFTGTNLYINNIGGTNFSLGFVPAVNVPYFVGVSAQNGLAPYFAITNLQTGQITAGVSGTGNYVTGAASGGAYALGNWTGANVFIGKESAVCYSAGAMSKSELLAWAADPWSFWYPNK